MNKIQKWHFLGRSLLLDHPRLKIVEDSVELPNGTVTQYVRQLPTKQHSVAIIALDGKRRILLQQEYSYPPDEVLWQLPGGSIENKETPETAALRELSEESAYTADNAQLVGYYYTNNRRSNEKQYVVICTNLRHRKLAPDPEEFIKSEWITDTELDRMISNNSIHNINMLAAIQLWRLSKTDLPPEKS